MLARTRFFSSGANVEQAKRSPRSGPGRPRGRFTISRGGPWDPKVARSLSKVGLGGALGTPRDEKSRNRSEKFIFKIVRISVFF